MKHLEMGLPSWKSFFLLASLFFLSAFSQYCFLQRIEERKTKEFFEVSIKQNIVALGDSLTEGYRVEKPYTEILGEFLQTDIKNCGEGGTRINEISENIDRCINESTDIVIFWGGANDLKYSTSLEEMINDFEYAIEQLSGKAVIVLTIPSNIELGEEKQVLRKDFNEYLKQRDGIRVVDIYEVLRDKEDENKMNNLYHLKGVHLNQLGYYVVANMVYKEINDIPK